MFLPSMVVFLSIHGMLCALSELVPRFMSGHVGWNQDRVDSVLLPLLKRVNNREVHGHVYSGTSQIETNKTPLN